MFPIQDLCDLRVLRGDLKKSQSAQIVARLVEAATADRSDEFAPALQAFDINLPIAPREKVFGEGKRTRILVLEHHHGLICVPLMFRRKHCGPEHIEKSMHLRFYFVAKLADWMMQPGREFDRKLIRRRGYKRVCDL